MSCQRVQGRRVPNRLVAADMSLEEMRDAIKNLSHFGFDVFRSNNNGIIGDTIEELPTHCAVVDATSELFWSNVEGAEKYNKDLAKKVMKDTTVLRWHAVCRNSGEPRLSSSITFSLQHIMLPLYQSLAYL